MLTLLALLSVFVCGTKGLIQFLQEPSDVVVRPSDPLWWHCTARLTGTTTSLTYLWSKDDQRLPSNSNVEKFQNGTLHLREVRIGDTGTYQCRAQGGGEIAYSQTATLSLAALAADFATNPSSGDVNIGNSLILQCSVESIPPATVIWQHNGDPVHGGDVTIATQVIDTHTESSLSITSVEHRHGGHYRCLATNSLLEGQTRYSESATVVLVGRPGFVTLPSPQVSIIGSSVTFLCATTTSPAATIQWLNPAENIIQNSQRFLVSGGNLRIDNVQLSDEGYYTCKATNEYGTNTAAALLTVTSTFEPVAFTRTPVDQTVELGNRLTFACEADGVPSPVITWSKQSDGSLPSSRTSEPAPGWLRIDQVEASDSGVYICTASNGLSTSSRSVHLTVQEQPRFITVPDDVTILEGDSITLECQGEGNPQPEISWTTPVTSLGTLQSPSKPTANIEVAENGSLILSSVQQEYSGIFTCLASNSISTISTEATVIVHGPPVIIQAPQDVTTVEGSTVTFTCRAAAMPAVTSVSWVFQSEQLSTNLKYEVFGNGDLRINNIEKDQEGMYSCQAVNSIGQSGIKSAYLTVMVPPKFETQPSDHTLEVGSNVTLHCEASGDPTPTLEWFKDDEELILSDNVMLLTNFSLVITDLQKVNTGRYQCIASNIAGSSQATAVVMTPDIPEFSSTAENITANQSQSVSLPCRATAREAPTIRWYLSDSDGTKGDQIGLGRNDPGSQGFLASVGTDGDLDMSLVSLNDEGWYLCEAENSVGSQEKLFYLSVNCKYLRHSKSVVIESLGGPVSNHSQFIKSLVHRVSRHPASVSSASQLSAEDSSQIILTCDVDGKPPPKATWFLPSGEPVIEMANKYFINNRGLTSYLVIYQPEVKLHDGDFICEAENFLGSSTSSVTVSIEGVPVIVEVLATPSPSSVTLRCLSKGAPTPETTWYRNGVRANSVSQHSVQPDDALVITDLGAARVGQYECQLENKYGSVSASLQAPGQPSIPQINTITARSISVSWVTPAPISNLSVSSYIVNYHPLGNISSVLAGTTQDTSVTVSGLKPYSGYHFSVQARNGLGTGAASDFSELVFTAEDVPGAVRDVSVEAVGSSILVSWDEPEEVNGNPMHIVYEILYGPVNVSVSDHMTYVKTNDGTNVHLLADLHPAASYRVAVRTGNTYLGVYSEASVRNIVTGYPSPISILQGFTLMPNGTSSIMVTWKPINPPAFQAYIIRYRDTQSADIFDDIIITDSKISQYLITSLKSGTEYAVKVSYETQGGVAPFTEELFANLTEESLVDPSQRDKGLPLAVIGVLGGLLLVLLILLLVIFVIRWKKSKDDFQPSPGFDPDSLWINRRGSEKKGTYEVAIVNENYDPGDTLMSNDSAYDLGKTDVAGPSSGHLISEGVKPEKKKKKKKKWNDDLIYKNPSNPDVVLVKKAVLGEDPLPPQPVSSQGILNEDEGMTPNTTSEPINLDSTQSSSIAEFPVFPNADDGIRLAGDDVVFKDNKKQEKMNKKALDSLKKRQRQEQRERDRDFDIGYRKKMSIIDSIKGKFSRRKPSLDDIPDQDLEVVLSEGSRHGETAVLY
ncbi:Hemicentin-1 [Holothuria leucospilota]|uniref:Cell adhesion molecule-related/down-regulated by oncogenes n=1 Tax=Holothuria leucospilota TaxID=206669 RepID=A0A9Q1H6T9_HOLLE|nr:Hemicentin-1 [Holothuria leucospilota]